MKSDKQPAQSLDDLPRPGITISLERWGDLIAKEARLLELYQDDAAELEEELRCVSLLVAENAELRKDKARLDWLDNHDGAWDTYGCNYGDYRYYWGCPFRTLRAVIDAAMKENKP